MLPPLGFRRLLAQAIAEISASGYLSPEQIEAWVTRLRNAAERDLGSERQIDAETARLLGAVYDRLVERGGVVKYVPEVSRYTLAMVKPRLHAELDRRIMANVALIKLDRRAAVERTIIRFSGWSTSIPAGGDETVNRIETRAAIGENIARFKYEKRRCDIDQGHKLIAAIADIVAVEAGAIAAEWHDHGEHDKSYNYREEHMEMSGKVYLIRDSWAHKQGLVKSVHGFTDEIVSPGQEVYCRCWFRYITSPRRLEDKFLTAKGQEFVAGRLAA